MVWIVEDPDNPGASHTSKPVVSIGKSRCADWASVSPGDDSGQGDAFCDDERDEASCNGGGRFNALAG